MKIKEIKAKSILSRTRLPETEFVINPYIGCAHRCVYCYARFMKRFTGHPEPWGAFVDVKINAVERLRAQLRTYKGGEILFGSVTDPYQPLELKYKLTRNLLIELKKIDAEVVVLTKSDKVSRDCDILEGWDNALISISGSVADEHVRKQLEPGAPPFSKRIDALRLLHERGIRTALFISPIMPRLTDWKALVDSAAPFVDEFWFENLNFYPFVRKGVYGLLKKTRPDLVPVYAEIAGDPDSFWVPMEKEIKDYCTKKGLPFRIYFHHKKRVEGN